MSVYTFSCCSSSSLWMSLKAWRVSHMISRAPVRVFCFTALLFWPGKHNKTSDMRLYSCPSSLSQLIFPAVCVSHPPWWTPRRPLSPEACGAARTGRHSDLWRAARPYCNAAPPELCAAYGRSRLQPDREKQDQHSVLSLTVCWRWRCRLFLCRCLISDAVPGYGSSCGTLKPVCGG